MYGIFYFRLSVSITILRPLRFEFLYLISQKPLQGGFQIKTRYECCLFLIPNLSVGSTLLNPFLGRNTVGLENGVRFKRAHELPCFPLQYSLPLTEAQRLSSLLKKVGKQKFF